MNACRDKQRDTDTNLPMTNEKHCRTLVFIFGTVLSSCSGYSNSIMLRRLNATIGDDYFNMA